MYFNNDTLNTRVSGSLRCGTHFVYMGMHDLKPSSIDSSGSEPVIWSWRLTNCLPNDVT